MEQTEKRNRAGLYALAIGSVCVVTYLMSYYMRSILSVVSPTLVAGPDYTEESVALLSSVYMIVYAAGQLVNGFLGDYLRPKYMVLAGFLMGGTALSAFPLVPTGLPQVLCFGLLGFGFSMLRGPLVKTISENTEPKYARVCCALLSFTCYAGPLAASLLALFLDPFPLFTVSGIVAFAVAAGAFLLLTLLEKKGIVRPLERKPEAKTKKKAGAADFFAVFRIPRFIGFLFIGMIAEIIGTSASSWVPIFLNQALTFSDKTSGLIYSGMSILRSLAPILCILLYHLFGENDVKLMRIMFVTATASFLLTVLIPIRIVRIVFVTLALITNSCAASALWTIYIPGLAKSGKVSGANGVIDCAGYVGASGMNLVFAAVRRAAGWNGLVGTWAAVELIGVAITFFVGANRKEENAEITD